MRDPKLWLDIAAAGWMVFFGVRMKTENLTSGFIFKFAPISLAFLLAMSQARAIF